MPGILGNIIVLLVLAAAVVFAVRSIRNRIRKVLIVQAAAVNAAAAAAIRRRGQKGCRSTEPSDYGCSGIM